MGRGLLTTTFMGHKIAQKNCIRNKTFLFVKIESWNFQHLYDFNLVKPHKINFIFLDKRKSFVPKKVTKFAQFHCNWIAVFYSRKYLFELTSGFFHTYLIEIAPHWPYNRVNHFLKLHASTAVEIERMEILFRNWFGSGKSCSLHCISTKYAFCGK